MGEDWTYFDRIHRQKLQDGEPVYIAPELYPSVLRRVRRNRYVNKYKSDTFSLGLVLLRCGLNQDIQLIYSGGELDRSALKALVDEFQLRFADYPLLHTTVRMMLETDPSRRPDFIELKAELGNFEEVKEYLMANEGDSSAKFEQTSDISMQKKGP